MTTGPDRVAASHAAALAWVPGPKARPYMIPDEVPGVRVRVNGWVDWLDLGDDTGPIKAPHWPFKPEVLEAVEAEMRERQHCVIRAVYEDDLWKACEGSHRIWAASQLGVTIDLQPVSRSYRLQHDNPDLGIVTAGDIIDVGPRIRGPEALYRMEVVE